MSDYYEILGVSKMASEAEIKRAYRKLVVLYHPDKNQNPNADDKIKAINEAYDVLSDREKRRSYDLGFYRQVIDSNVTSEPPPPRHRDPAYRRRRPPVNPSVSSQSAMREMMGAYMPIVSRISLIAFAFCVILFLDRTVPSIKSTEQIVDSYTFKGFGRGYSPAYIIVTNKGRHYKISSLEVTRFQKEDMVTISLTRFFHVPLSIRTNSNSRIIFYTTIYQNFIFMPILLFITSSLGVFLKTNIDLRFNIGVMNFLVLLLTIFFLFSHKFFT